MKAFAFAITSFDMCSTQIQWVELFVRHIPLSSVSWTLNFKHFFVFNELDCVCQTQCFVFNGLGDVCAAYSFVFIELVLFCQTYSIVFSDSSNIFVFNYQTSHISFNQVCQILKGQVQSTEFEFSYLLVIDHEWPV